MEHGPIADLNSPDQLDLDARSAGLTSHDHGMFMLIECTRYSKEGYQVTAAWPLVAGVALHCIQAGPQSFPRSCGSMSCPFVPPYLTRPSHHPGRTRS